MPVPEGLDLDKWIVPPPVMKTERVVEEEDENDPVSVNVGGIKKRKGKEKDKDGDGRAKTKKKKAKDGAETEEDKAARAKVSSSAITMGSQATRLTAYFRGKRSLLNNDAMILIILLIRSLARRRETMMWIQYP